MKSSPMNTFSHTLDMVLGISAEPKDLTFVQILLSGVIFFVVTLIAVRLSNKCSLAEKTEFGAILVIIVRSMLAPRIYRK
jgi:hypothetical protein